MKKTSVRIYSEEELLQKAKQAEAMLRRVLNPDTREGPDTDLRALHELWIACECTRIVLTGALDMGLHHPQILHVMRDVEDDYDDSLKDAEKLYDLSHFLHLYFSDLKHSLRIRYKIAEAQYEDKREFVKEFAADIYMHINHQREVERQKMTDILWWLNYAYVQDNENEYVTIREIEVDLMAKGYKVNTCVDIPNLPEIITWAEEHFAASDIHDISHWKRVAVNGKLLCECFERRTPWFTRKFKEKPNLRVITLFAFLHDSHRVDDGCDMEHGPRAAKAISEIRNTLLSYLSDKEFWQLQEAIKYHTSATSHPDVTVATCFDADRLDLVRIGIQPNPQYMATPCGKYLAEHLPRF